SRTLPPTATTSSSTRPSTVTLPPTATTGSVTYSSSCTVTLPPMRTLDALCRHGRPLGASSPASGRTRGRDGGGGDGGGGAGAPAESGEAGACGASGASAGGVDGSGARFQFTRASVGR